MLPESPFCTAAQIAEQWKKNVAGLQEYQVIRDGSVFRAHLADSFLFHSEYQKALRLREELLERYKGKELDEVLPGEEVETSWGTTFALSTTLPCDPVKRVSIDGEELFSDLTLVRGIGAATARHLKGRGYQTVKDLLHHPRFRTGAAHLIERVQSGDPYAIQECIETRYPKSHPRVLEVSRFIEPSNFLFIDIETLGIFSRPIILLGIGRLIKGQTVIQQLLLRDPAEEPAAIAATLSALNEEGSAVVTFNGKSFDLPYIRDRAAFYGASVREKIPHFDLLHFSRRTFRGMYANYRLTTLERHLFGLERSGDVPSQLVPEFYESYLTSGNPGPLIPIIEHNRQDVLSLIRLYHRLIGDVA
ncbi:MAG: ribonuclease H-like domain-containing protein [Methanomicrobiales archaeon]|nr:ribonuclease H-like domain-containing protein [Methanomicrobiales archaeon]